MPASMGTSSDEHEWAGEAYEEDKEGAFHKFCMLVQHVPQQCIRYRCAVLHHRTLLTPTVATRCSCKSADASFDVSPVSNSRC